MSDDPVLQNPPPSRAQRDVTATTTPTDSKDLWLSHVHPSGWKNPTPKRQYDLVVIGAGPAGLVAAAGAAGLGADVALIEKEFMGGDCLNFGCVPSKALLRAAHAAHDVREASRFGIHVDEPTIDFQAVMRRVVGLRADMAENDAVERFSALGIDVFLGAGTFSGRRSVRVGDDELRFSRALIATGAKSASLPISGLAEAGFLTNETVFDLEQRPKHLIVIGAGPIGCELAQAFRRLGSRVTIVALDPRVLPKEDADAAAALQTQLESEGIDFHLGSGLQRVEHGGGLKTVFFEKDGTVGEVTGDEILLAAGRRPVTDGLGLEAAGVNYERTGIEVDDRLQTSNRRVYAAGDVCSQYQFTHAADAMARIVIQNALFFGRKKVSAVTIPWATYTDPEISHVGMSAEEAEAGGDSVRTQTVSLASLDRAVLDGTKGFARVHHKPNGTILGATIVGGSAGDLIGEMALAMSAGVRLGQLADAVHPYPTQSEVLKRLGDTYNGTRLTPSAKRWLQRIIRWRRWSP